VVVVHKAFHTWARRKNETRCAGDRAKTRTEKLTGVTGTAGPGLLTSSGTESSLRAGDLEGAGGLEGKGRL